MKFLPTAEKVESIYDRIEQTLDTIKNTESCSLRRTRSLAVIREETFNDLQIGGIRTRRSQLIPRAKLLDRGFFQNRYLNSTGLTGQVQNNYLIRFLCFDFRDKKTKKKYREEDSGSGVDTQTSETRESDDYYANLKNINVPAVAGGVLLPTLWINDKSDLDSLDSDYFKNSLHQLDGQKEKIVTESRTHEDGTESQVQNIYIGETQSINEHVENIPDYCTIRTEEDDIDQKSDRDGECEGVANLLEGNVQTHNGFTANSAECSETDEGTVDRKSKFKEDHKSVISYDSIYLSSEGSGEATVIDEEKINEYLSDNNYSTLSEYAKFQKNENSTEANQADAEHENHEDNGDLLYSKINKHKPKVVQLEPKASVTKLTSFSDISTRGTLERLTFVSSPAVHRKEAATDRPVPIIRQLSSSAYSSDTVDNQYCSLPVANISKSLQASERIDAKLRLSCVPLAEQENTVYNSITHFGRTHKRLRQRESFEIVVLNPISIDEQPKDSASIDLTPSLKEITQVEVKKKNKEPKVSRSESLDVKRVKDSPPAAVKIPKEKRAEESKVRRTEEKPKKVPKLSDIQIRFTDSRDNIIEEAIDVPVVKVNDNQAVIRRNQRKLADRHADHKERLPSNFKTTLSNTLKRRLENKAKTNLNEKPILRFVRNIDKSKNNNKTNKVHQAILESFASASKPRINMSRPQILNVVDSKRHTVFRSPIKTAPSNKGKLQGDNIYGTKERTHKEFQEKVDSVRNYWSKLIDEQEEEAKDNFGADEFAQVHEDEIEIRAPTIPAADVDSKFRKTRVQPSPLLEPLLALASLKPLSQQQPTPSAPLIPPAPPMPPSPASLKPVSDEFSSNQPRISVNGGDRRRSGGTMDENGGGMEVPSVEIVELDNQKQAALVKVQNSDTQEFDHVRYKVMRSDTFQKNILAQTRKEAQFDGLLQYLQDYSFQVSHFERIIVSNSKQLNFVIPFFECKKINQVLLLIYYLKVSNIPSGN